MHIPTHILSGWVLSNCVPLKPRERLLCMIAATIPDLDGLGILLGQDAYQRWHHVIGHNLPFCIVVSIVFVMMSKRKISGAVGLFFIYALAFHLHLLMDYFGSGPGWPIVYFWPLSDFKFVNWNAWELSSWQNTISAAILLLITILIAIFKKRTPLEILYPRLDQRFTGQLGKSDRALTVPMNDETSPPR